MLAAITISRTTSVVSDGRLRFCLARMVTQSGTSPVNPLPMARLGTRPNL